MARGSSIIIFTTLVLYLASAAAGANPYAQPPPQAAVAEGKKWCVPKPNSDEKVLQDNIDYVCSKGIDYCKAIQVGGDCFEPNTVVAHARYAMNAYYVANGRNNVVCDFKKTGTLIDTDPSYDKCAYA